MMKMMSEKYVEQVLNIYNHVDTVILTDTKGYITYFVTYRPDVNPHRPKKHDRQAHAGSLPDADRGEQHRHEGNQERRADPQRAAGVSLR